jgi:hypothetical protein
MYESLTTQDIINVILSSPRPPAFHLSGRLRHTKRPLLRKLLADGPHWAEALGSVIATKNNEARLTRQTRANRETERLRARSAVRTERTDIQELDKFLDLPSTAEVEHCYRAFYDATSNDALRVFICAVCARSLNSKTERFSNLPLCELPNRDRLRPLTQHNGQILTEGFLLEPRGCVRNGDGWDVDVCRDCYNELKVCLFSVLFRVCSF